MDWLDDTIATSEERISNIKYGSKEVTQNEIWISRDINYGRRLGNMKYRMGRSNIRLIGILKESLEKMEKWQYLKRSWLPKLKKDMRILSPM